jgi:hypothetical protein
MKNCLVFFVLCFSLHTYAQKPDTVRLKTAFGKPDGKETSEKIGKEGGKLVSSDARIELVIPPGALSKKTTISIQPVNNTLTAARGKSYHLEPSGTTFKQPVEIIFHYDDRESNTNDPQLRGIAMQDEKGQWRDLTNIAIDTINKTISGKINHFSYWVDYERVSITPASGKVKVSKEIALQLNTYVPSAGEDDGSGDVLPDLPPMSLVTVNLPPVWSANGVVNGNAAVGTVRATGNAIQATYRAPATVPARNPVAVSAELKNLNFSVGGRTFQNLKVTSNVLVYDENTFEVKLFAWVDQTSLACGARAEDVGSFIVQVQYNTVNMGRVTDMQNSLMTIPKPSGCPCNQNWINRAVTTGPIHMEGVQNIWVTAPNPPSQPHGHVRIMFRAVPAIYPVFSSCPQYGGVPTVPGMMQAMPTLIEFDTKKEEQVLYDIKESMVGLKITVRQVSEE